MWVSSAYAMSGGAEGGNPLVSLLPLVLIFVIFYFLLIRPQQKKVKEHKEMVSALRRGDQVVTSGGVVGTVTKVIDDTYVQVEIAEGVKVRIVRGTVTEVLSKTNPAPAKEEKGRSRRSKKSENSDAKAADADGSESGATGSDAAANDGAGGADKPS